MPDNYPDISSRLWRKDSPPHRILAIRLQAMGDLVITLPYLQQLRRALPPDSELDLLTRQEDDAIPRNIHLFNRVYSLGGGRSTRKQILHSCLLWPRLLLRQYDAIIDLQNNLVSRLIRRSLLPAAWSAFDRFSPIAAGERTRLTIEAIGLGPNSADTFFSVKNSAEAEILLKAAGWDPANELVILNPAGAFESRHWPIHYFERFADHWLQSFPDTQFLVLGLGLIAEKAGWLENKLGGRLINLVDKTTPAQAFSMVQRVKFILSEDSGLMHMAWVSGIPTLALFGSTRSDWSRPLGNHTFFLDASDLPCGNCMQEFCRYGDTHCLSRYTPEMVFEKALNLYNLSWSSYPNNAITARALSSIR